MPKVLIVSPHFPPVNTADMQRVRMLLPFFKENGWEAEVLAVSPEQVASPCDHWLADGLPNDVRVHRVKAMSLGWSRIPGLGTLGLRALRALDREGGRLLEKGGFDLVYFSTTVFEAHLLGPRWKRRFGVPFAMDYQDPWVNDYYRDHPQVRPPGGRLKYAAMDALHRWMEPRVLRHCTGITSVSPEYPKQLARRYPGISIPHILVDGFPGADRDFARLPETSADMADEILDWVYVGRGGTDMSQALRGIFRALRDHASPDLRSRLRLHFLGTSYARAGQGKCSIAPLAADYGLEGIVEECPDRIPYCETLAHLKQADALLVPGSDDPAYTASKIYPYLLARRPMLAVFHEASTVVSLIDSVGGAVCVPFATDEDEAHLATRIAEAWLRHDDHLRIRPLDETAFHPHTDQGSAVRLTTFFSACVRARR